MPDGIAGQPLNALTTSYEGLYNLIVGHKSSAMDSEQEASHTLARADVLKKILDHRSSTWNKEATQMLSVRSEQAGSTVQRRRLQFKPQDDAKTRARPYGRPFTPEVEDYEDRLDRGLVGRTGNVEFHAVLAQGR